MPTPSAATPSTGQLKDADLEIQSARERLAAVRARRIDSEQNRLAELQGGAVATRSARSTRNAARSPPS